SRSSSIATSRWRAARAGCDPGVTKEPQLAAFSGAPSPLRGRGCLFLAGPKAWLAGQISDVLDLTRDPARDVARAYDVARPRVSPPLLLHPHHDPLMHRVGHRVDVERVDGQHVWVQLLVWAHVLG